MKTQDLNSLPASKGDIERILEVLRTPLFAGSLGPENPALIDLEKRLALIERVTKAVAGIGLPDLPIDVETASAITGMAASTLLRYGACRHIDTVKIGTKKQFSLRSCIQLVKNGSRKAVIDCTTDMSNYRRKKQKR
jgi:hypothetical protein